VGVLFTKGSGIHEIDFNSYDIVPGSVFMLFPGQVHTWKVSKDIDGYIFFHDKEFYNLNFTREKVENYPFFSSTENIPLIILKDGEVSGIVISFREIVAEYQNRQLMGFQKICSLLNVLYIDLSRAYLPVAQRAKQNETQLMQVRRLEILIVYIVELWFPIPKPKKHLLPPKVTLPSESNFFCARKTSSFSIIAN
jgi:hypothetical protein